MQSLTVHPAASRELDEALTWCRERFGRRISDRLLLQFDRAATLLRAHPEIGSVDASGARKLPLPRFPYSVIYRIEADGERIVVMALHHQRRKAGYWVGRR
ncbi:type II toxin-antitoxin system RelE/ParE family toxin [Roseateles sp. DC23W]|uniref:Type II toxin-antitoxin system RelE/ParE family toxin n=1 Tax=Pelomonas dachongensis TaxID=3299029 RepID=A0ABW7ERZ4_9BURK